MDLACPRGREPSNSHFRERGFSVWRGNTAPPSLLAVYRLTEYGSSQVKIQELFQKYQENPADRFERAA
jgi:hypothetical protein